MEKKDEGKILAQEFVIYKYCNYILYIQLVVQGNTLHVWLPTHQQSEIRSNSFYPCRQYSLQR